MGRRGSLGKRFHSNPQQGSYPDLWRRANARNVSFENLCGDRFTLSTQLVILNYPVILSHRRSTTVSLENDPLNHLSLNLELATFTVKSWHLLWCLLMSHGLMILFSKLKVIVLWNKGQKQVRYDWLPGGWCVNESEEPLTKARLSVMLEDLLSGEGKLRYTSSIPRIYNEHAPVSTLAQTLRTCIYPKCSTNPDPSPFDNSSTFLTPKKNCCAR